MAETVHLKLSANNSEIQGESTQTSLGRENTIECVFYLQSVKTVREKGTALSTGRRFWEGVVIKKRLDKATPLIMDALCTNKVIEAEFMFFRPNPAGDGTTEHYMTTKLTRARIASQRMVSPDALNTETSDDPMLEEVEIVFHTISVAYLAAQTEAMDTWDANA